MSFKRPPKIKSADDFISGAMTSVQAEPQSVAVPSPAAAPASSAAEPTGFPWEGKRSDKQTELFNLRLTEVELEKLRYIAAHTPDSMQAFVRKALLPAINAKLKELIS